LQKNPDFEKVKSMVKILNGKSMELGATNSNLPFLFSFAPVTSFDCERPFPRLTRELVLLKHT